MGNYLIIPKTNSTIDIVLESPTKKRSGEIVMEPKDKYYNVPKMAGYNIIAHHLTQLSFEEGTLLEYIKSFKKTYNQIIDENS